MKVTEKYFKISVTSGFGGLRREKMVMENQKLIHLEKLIQEIKTDVKSILENTKYLNMKEINTPIKLLEEVNKLLKPLEEIRNALDKPNVKNEDFESYKKRFYELVYYPKKGN